MSEKTPGGVQSVERVFVLLELITDAVDGATLSELAASTSLPLPTIHRLLRTLIALGYARQLPNRRYVLGSRLIRIGDAAGRQFGSLAIPQLTSLVDQLGETANMAMLDGDMVMYVAQAPSAHSMRMFTEVGRRVHAHDSGVGKAILAQLDDSAVRRIIGRTGMPTPTDKSLGTIKALLTDLQQIRARGYAIDDNEQEIGVRCYAVLVPDAPTPTAISVSGPVSRVDESFGGRAVPLLHQAAGLISDGLSRSTATDSTHPTDSTDSNGE